MAQKKAPNYAQLMKMWRRLKRADVHSKVLRQQGRTSEATHHLVLEVAEICQSA